MGYMHDTYDMTSVYSTSIVDVSSVYVMAKLFDMEVDDSHLPGSFFTTQRRTSTKTAHLRTCSKYKGLSKSL